MSIQGTVIRELIEYVLENGDTEELMEVVNIHVWPRLKSKEGRDLLSLALQGMFEHPVDECGWSLWGRLAWTMVVECEGACEDVKPMFTMMREKGWTCNAQDVARSKEIEDDAVRKLYLEYL